ncbi:universal stress protein [Rhodopirellula bahusiensis]|uniref:Universal stress protein n=1 Tax=Rhodopirellula bahusiensis TaxID=2014065 RepID=A0A2G1VZP4_9BACT|nr:universal stress protein [Rhodopirellula bahusiensis]PHQ32266.1 universal stress protein [Rhodopirellula bahusiensis]
MKKILLTIDGSDASLEAARFMVQLNFRQPVEIVVATVIHEPPSQKSFLVDGWSKAWLLRKREQANRSFEEVQAIFGDLDVQFQQVVREGHPGETIVSLAKELQPDLVVVGAKGHSAVERILLGSTSDYVATHVPGSVLVVRQSDDAGRPERLRIAIGCDPSQQTETALDEFMRLGWAGEADVRVLSVTDRSVVDDFSEDEVSRRCLENAFEKLNAVAPSSRGMVIHCDHVGDGLVDYVDSNQVDLVIVGETPRGGFERMLLGSTTRFVLRHASSSVLIARRRRSEDAQDESVSEQTASV